MRYYYGINTNLKGGIILGGRSVTVYGSPVEEYYGALNRGIDSQILWVYDWRLEGCGILIPHCELKWEIPT